MRVLWFTNVPLPQVAAAAGLVSAGGGHWMSELFRAVIGTPGLQLGIATAFPGLRDIKFEQDGATFYGTGQRRRASTFGGTRAELGRCADMVRDFQPDLVHFHGSERFFGLLKANGMVRTPAVLSLQGVLTAYAQFRNFFGALSPWDIVRSTRIAELPLGLGLLRQYADINGGARQEARILASIDAVLGRTEWDESWARVLAPQASYYRVGEILRQPFAAARWTLGSCERHTLVYTNAGLPRRGTENLLAAAAMLLSEFPSLRLRLAGNISERSGYGRFLRRRIAALGLANHVDLLGYLDAAGMAAVLARSHVFCITSYIENSPNSLAEAMRIGTPCVASFAGGIPSMVEDGRTALMFPVDDVLLLTARIRALFRDDALTVRIGAAARDVATARHDPARVAGELLGAYASVLAATAG